MSAEDHEAAIAERNGDETSSARAGVFVFSENLERGKSAVRFTLVGDVDPLIVPTLLEMATAAARAQLGLRQLP